MQCFLNWFGRRKGVFRILAQPYIIMYLCFQLPSFSPSFISVVLPFFFNILIWKCMFCWLEVCIPAGWMKASAWTDLEAGEAYLISRIAYNYFRVCYSLGTSDLGCKRWTKYFARELRMPGAHGVWSHPRSWPALPSFSCGVRLSWAVGASAWQPALWSQL